MAALLSIRDVQAQTGVGARTLRAWIRQGIVGRPLGRGPGARYTEEHVLVVRVIQHLRSKRVPLRQIRTQLARLTAPELQALLPTERQPVSADHVPPPPPTPSYPFRAYEVVELMPGLLILVDTGRGEVLRRVANEIYRHYALRVAPHAPGTSA